MYRYKIHIDPSSIDDFTLKDDQPNAFVMSPVYVDLNSQGFADLLSCNLETLIDLKSAKDKIEQIRESVWEEIKKVTNPYEFIYAAPNCSIADIKPLSRSFFKMVEIITEFASSTIFQQNDAFVSLHIAEGPGGFIEATRYIRKSKASQNLQLKISNDFAFGITLLNTPTPTPTPSNIPAWKQSNYFLRNHPEVIISTGADGTGNIYNPENIKKLYLEMQGKCSTHARPVNILSSTTSTTSTTSLSNISNTVSNDNSYKNNYKNIFANLDIDPVITNINNTNNSGSSSSDGSNSSGGASNGSIGNLTNTNANGYAMFISADGGFDYSIDYNYQEQASSKLIFSQILTALKCQAQGGMFICKVFDINLYITVEMIYLLYKSYDNVTIYKPVTSRIANSEKYLVCSGFKGVDNQLLETLFTTLDAWNKANANNKTINQLFDEIPKSFIEELKRLNSIIVKKQIEVINGIMNIYYNKLNLDSQWKKENYKKQHEHAITWCVKYNIPYKHYTNNKS